MFKLGYGFLFLSESLFEIDNLPPNSFSTATLPPTHWYSSSLAFLVFASFFFLVCVKHCLEPNN